jgi:hypothetical protein
MSKKDSLDTFCQAIELVEKIVYQKAFDAALAYEKNCRAKYDRWNQTSLPIPKGEQMIDFAMKYGTTVKEMKNCEFQVEQILGIDI